MCFSEQKLDDKGYPSILKAHKRTMSSDKIMIYYNINVLSIKVVLSIQNSKYGFNSTAETSKLQVRGSGSANDIFEMYKQSCELLTNLKF